MVGKIQVKKIWILSIALCFLATLLLSYKSSLGAPLLVVVFAPIYEEVIFRGGILGALKGRLGAGWAVVISAGLFGLWHLKNLAYYEVNDTVYQMAYAGLVLGPILGWIAVKARSILPGMVLHYFNNIGSLALMMVSVDWRGFF